MKLTQRFTWSLALASSLSLHAMLFYQADKQVGIDEQPREARQVTHMSFHSARAPQKELKTSEHKRPVTEKKQKARKQQSEKNKSVPHQEQRKETIAPSQQATQSQQDMEQLQAQRKRDYLGVLLAHIEKHKFYPRTARRRGLEGDVPIRFMMLSDNNIKILQANGSHAVLQQAAKEAVTSALPFPTPPVDLSLPLMLEFSIRYQLR